MTAIEIAKVAVFEGKHIRKILHDGEWWFSVVDVVEVLTGNERPRCIIPLHARTLHINGDHL